MGTTRQQATPKPFRAEFIFAMDSRFYIATFTSPPGDAFLVEARTTINMSVWQSVGSCHAYTCDAENAWRAIRSILDRTGSFKAIGEQAAGKTSEVH